MWSETLKPLERPADADLRAALDRVLASAAFARSERLRAFLAYVVTCEIEGKASQLKGYTIAVDVFRRPDAFNADSDPLVRVHAGKLRKLLAGYYETEGADDTIQIDIPKGGYTPVYLRRDPVADQPDYEPGEVDQAEIPDIVAFAQPPHESSPEPLQVSPERSPPLPRWRKPAWLPAPLASPMAMISIVPLLLFVPVSSTALGVSPQIQARLSISTKADDIGLPRVTIRTDSEKDTLATELAHHLRTAMDYYTVIIPETGPPDLRVSDPKSLGFTIALVPDGAARTRITVSSDATGDVISQMWIDNERLSNDFDLLFESLGIASKTLATNGDLFHYAQDKGIASPLMQCMLVTDTYRREKSREALKEARFCQEKLLGPKKREREFVISASELKRNVHP
jgi:hypothetical protein